MIHVEIWWILTGFLLVLEMLSGTFYLLMLCLGTVCAALIADMGGSISTQFAIASALSIVACLILTFWRKKNRQKNNDYGNPKMDSVTSLDIGQYVNVDKWSVDSTAQVHYRGAMWTAVLQGGAAIGSNRYKIVGVIGSRLIVKI
jgi:membrane protein implicated in regulation of membrane protease activity